MEKAKQILVNQFDEMVQTLQQVIRFNTEKAPATADAPFGKGIDDCLKYVLDKAKQFGLKTYDCDGYAGHVDFEGTTEETLGILGHLDVVPAKAEEWIFPPYSATISDGKMFGRGTMDDKGPMIACLFAVKALKESGFVPSKTVRLIFGCDEESGMQCVKRYFEKMPFPTVSFSPDGDFPVINIEKGIYQFDVKCGKLPQGVCITAGERANVVPSICKVTCPIKLQADGAKEQRQADGSYAYESFGKSAHGSTPDEGVNATHVLLRALANAYPNNQTLSFVAGNLCDTTGAKWGVDLSDQDSGKLTCNLGVLRTLSDGTLVVTVDIRFPASYNCNQMYDLLRKNTPAQFEILPDHVSDPLYVSAQTPLVSTLMDVYNGNMNANAKPLAIGGGTYSRCLPNCVAFGPLFPGEEQTIHMPNECVSLDNLLLMAQLYLQAIYRLAK